MELAEEIELLLSRAGANAATWGLSIYDPEEDRFLYRLNADSLLAIASNTKLFTVTACLRHLGSDYRFRTLVHHNGQVQESGVLKGSLTLVGSGDFTLGGRTEPSGTIATAPYDHIYANHSPLSKITQPDPLAGLDDLAAQVKHFGISHLDGDVIIDSRLFVSTPSSGSGPSEISALIINDNLWDFTVTPGLPGQTASVEIRPQSRYPRVDCRVMSVSAIEDTNVIVETIGPDSFVLRGTITSDSEPILRVAEFSEPDRVGRALFIEALERNGVTVAASLWDDNAQLAGDDDADSCEKVAEFESPTLISHLYPILKISHNLHTCVMPLLLLDAPRNRTLHEGLTRQREILADFDLPVESMSFSSGAGGAPADMASPAALVALLRSWRKMPEFPELRNCLPILGVDGTLGTVGCELKTKGRVFAKTGTVLAEDQMNDRVVVRSKALSGYLNLESGRELIFSFVVNNYPLKKNESVASVGELLAELCEIVYRSVKDPIAHDTQGTSSQSPLENA